MDLLEGSVDCATAVALVAVAAVFFPRPPPAPDLSDSRRGPRPVGSVPPSPVVLAAAG